jgi:hypothetical protein
MVATRFQGHIGGSAAGTLTGHAQGMHLCVRAAGKFVPPLADNLTVAHHHTTDTRVGGRGEKAAFCQLQRTSHEALIVESKGIHGFHYFGFFSLSSSES